MSNAVYPALPGLQLPVKRTPVWKTITKGTPSGREFRSSAMTNPRHRYALRYEFLRSQASLAEYQALFDFFNARDGAFDTFLFSDPDDNTVTQQVLGTGNGSTTQWQLARALGANALEPVYDLNGTLAVYLNDWQGLTQVYSTARTNLLLQSAAFDNASWSKPFGGTGFAPTVTANQFTSPDGTVTADRVQMDKGAGASAADQSGVTQAYTSLVVGQAYTFSGWIKAQTGSPVVQVRIFGTTLALTVAGNAWQKFALTAIASATTDNVYVWLRGGQGTSNAADVSIWGAQLEVGSTATRYIPTTTAAATVTDYSINGSGLVTFTTAPAAGVPVSWTGSYYWRCRFERDELEFSKFLDKFWSTGAVNLLTCKP